MTDLERREKSFQERRRWNQTLRSGRGGNRRKGKRKKERNAVNADSDERIARNCGTKGTSVVDSDSKFGSPKKAGR
jgi:hypothetical protein